MMATARSFGGFHGFGYSKMQQNRGLWRVEQCREMRRRRYGLPPYSAGGRKAWEAVNSWDLKATTRCALYTYLIMQNGCQIDAEI